MVSVAVNSPKTPVTEGSGDVAASTVPGVYKMPGPPAPFVPTPFPNIGKSSDNLDCTKKTKIEGKKVANKGTTFKSTGSPDAASKGSGGGVVSSTEEGKTEFAAPGSMNVKMESKNVQLLGEAMTNDDKNGGATLPGNIQAAASALGISEEDAAAICAAFCEALGEHKEKVKNGTIPKRGYHITDRFDQILRDKNIPGLGVQPSFIIPPSGVAEMLTPSLFAQAAGFLAEVVPESAARLGGLLATGAAAEAGTGGSVGMMAGVALSGVLIYGGTYLREVKAMFDVGPSFLGRIVRPDLTLTRNGMTKALDAKFPKDAPGRTQESDYKKIDHENKYREISCVSCAGCEHC
jgi:hypothetical protein